VPQAQPMSTRSYVLCGAIQLAAFLGWSALAGIVAVRGYEWVAGASGMVELYLRSIVVGGAGLIGLCALPVAAKWILIGRWKPTEFPIWSMTYARFWIVKILLHVNPMVLFVGNPLYVLYLRALGAHVGKRVTILSPSLPIATDLLTIGDDTVIRKDSFFSCYRAQAGRIEIGPVTLGSRVFVGEKTVLDIRTAMGDGTQLGHTSALQAGEKVPDGEHWHGSPAQRTDVNYVSLDAASCGTLRRAAFGLATLLQVLFVYCPLAVGGTLLLASTLPGIDGLLQSGQTLDSAGLYSNALILSLMLFGGFLVVGPLVMFTIPRAVNRAMKPGVVYPLYGMHYSMHRSVARMTNVKFFKWLFGDSSFIVHYLRCLGYNLSHVEQTGSNFGTEVQHETPFLTTVGRGTMVADGLSVLNADYSSSSFSVTPATIGPHNFLGNNIAYPSGGRTGDDCLLATKVMVPLDGEVRTGVGLLGSPPFEIPRSVERDTRFDHLRTGAELKRRLTAKNRYNLATIGLFLVIRWFHVFLLTLIALLAFDVGGLAGALIAASASAAGLVLTTGYFILVERTIARFRPLQPRLTSIYEPYFWWHERLWKVPDTYLNIFNGTPFKNVVWKLLGVRLGKRVFDDGCYITERTLTSIGDDCTLNLGSKLQCHSQEDGTFKSDHSSVGARCTLGVGAFVHYGVTIGDEASLAADSFLMKGEEMPAGARWGGNPAAEKWSPREPVPAGGTSVAGSTPSMEVVT
jgi:non-ribosomal peptide synthetase-like protein